MRASIDKDGTMTITAEYDLARYALQKWWEDWHNGKAILVIEVEDKETGAIVGKKVQAGGAQ